MLIVEGYKIRNYAEHMTDEELFEFCVMNDGLQIERDADKNIIIMSPVGGSSGFYEQEIAGEIRNWINEGGAGLSFTSSTGFLLPNGAMRSPDGCWVSAERWKTVPEEAKDKFLPIVPDFVVELRSPSDQLIALEEKMREWRANGVRLGWLIDPVDRQVFIFREDGSVERIEGLEAVLSGEPMMPGFAFDLKLLRMP